jgi:hypothetical protein
MRKKILAFSLSLLFFGSIVTSTFGMASNNIDDDKDKAKTTTTTATVKKSDKAATSKTSKADCATKKSCCSAEKACKDGDGPDKK